MSFLTRGLNLTKCEKLQDSIDSQLREILDDDEFVSRILTTVEVLKGERFEPSPRPRDVRQQLAQILKAIDKLSGDAQLHIFKNVSLQFDCSILHWSRKCNFNSLFLVGLAISNPDSPPPSSACCCGADAAHVPQSNLMALLHQYFKVK